MQSFSTASSLRDELTTLRSSGKIVGLVPTMGNLHAGHLALVQKAATQCDAVVTSIFVNPTQFGPNEDFRSYPRTVENDKTLLGDAGCEIVFIPSVEEMYGDLNDSKTVIHASAVSKGFCGDHRPGHFDGVATIVAKLFNIVSPHKAYFGLKDYQQFLVIKQLVADLSFNVAIVGVETMRESSGLAMSSRNSYLTDDQRIKSAAIYQSLMQCRQAILEGDPDYATLADNALKFLTDVGIEPEYFAIRGADNLQFPNQLTESLVILTAAKVGSTRLIDNIRFSLPDL